MQQLEKAAENYMTNQETFGAIHHSGVCQEAQSVGAGVQEELDRHTSPLWSARVQFPLQTDLGIAFHIFLFLPSLPCFNQRNQSPRKVWDKTDSQDTLGRQGPLFPLPKRGC